MQRQLRAWLRDSFAILWGAALRFHRDDCLQRASALAYVSLVSAVPFLAVVFSVLKGLGVARRMEPAVFAQLGIPPETMASVIAAIDRIHVGVLGTLGAALLLFSVVGLLAAVEDALDDLWRAEGARGWGRRIREHLGLVLLTPFLLLAAIAITSSHHLGHVVRWAEGLPLAGLLIRVGLVVAPVILNVIGLLVLYLVLPSRRPHWRAVLFGAVVGGILWQLVQWFYVSLQIGVARYNAIYGALAQLPITLVWLYASWLVFLFGAECAAVKEFGPRQDGPSKYPRSIVAVQLLRSAWLAFCSGGGTIDPAAWAKRFSTPADVVLEVARLLASWGWLSCIREGPREVYILAAHPRGWDFARLAAEDHVLVPARVDPQVERLWQLRRQQAAEQWRELSAAPIMEELFPEAVVARTRSEPSTSA